MINPKDYHRPIPEFKNTNSFYNIFGIITSSDLDTWPIDRVLYGKMFDEKTCRNSRRLINVFSHLFGPRKAKVRSLR